MFAWVMKNIGWFITRVLVTLLCMFTIKHMAHTNGYYISYDVLLVSAICLIVGIRFWMPTCKDSIQ